jgi:hypothetical protein
MQNEECGFAILRVCVRALTRVRVLFPAPAAYLGEVHAAQLRPAGGASARGAFSLSLSSLLSPDSLAFEPPPGFDAFADASHSSASAAPSPPLTPVFNRRGGDRRIAGVPAALLHAALRVVVGGRAGPLRDALYAPLLRYAEAAKRAQRG